MVIEQISAHSVLDIARHSLGLSATGTMDEPFLAALLRRAAGFLCPCSPATLVSSVVEGLQYLGDDASDMDRKLAELGEKLIVVGDLLELNQVTIDDPDVPSTFVFAAPPTFVARPDGTIFLLGVVPDVVTPLPSSLAANVVYEGVARVLIPDASEDTLSMLRDLGWQELSVAYWRKAPKPETPSHMRESMFRRLEAQPPSGVIDELTILDPTSSPRHYGQRRINPTNQSGSFVARRPQAYGAPLWGYAALVNGCPVRFLDFPLVGMRWRGCDVAWHLQMAIDDGRGTPQVYRRRDMPDGVAFDFFSPLPLWAVRQLAVFGRPANRKDCLFSYCVPPQEADSDESFLRERLWLKRIETDESWT